jgi:predicted nucleic acid-binding protein
MKRAIVDTGPLVAYLNEREQHHDWTVETFSTVRPPLDTCEAVLAEATFLIGRHGGDPDDMLDLVERGLVRLSFELADELPRVRQLLRRYRDLPMSLADACLVRMSERFTDCVVVSLDNHFRIYRRHDRKTIPTLMPPNR